MNTYHYLDPDGKPEGPLTLEEMRALFVDGLLNRESQVSKDGSPWQPANAIGELRSNAAPVSVVLPPRIAAPTNPPNFGLWVLAALLVWPLGLVGAVVYLCDPKHRSAGMALFVIALASGLVTWVLILR